MDTNTNKNEISGVKEPESKIISSKPPIRRSVLGRKMLIRGENTRKFEELKQKITLEVLPKTEIEKILCEKFISAVWKHERTLEVERNMLSAQNAPENEDRPGNYDDLPLDEEPSKPSVRKRVRTIKKVRLDQNNVQAVLKYGLEVEKNMYKALEKVRSEQALRGILGETKTA